MNNVNRGRFVKFVRAETPWSISCGFCLVIAAIIFFMIAWRTRVIMSYHV